MELMGGLRKNPIEFDACRVISNYCALLILLIYFHFTINNHVYHAINYLVLVTICYCIMYFHFLPNHFDDSVRHFYVKHNLALTI